MKKFVEKYVSEASITEIDLDYPFYDNDTDEPNDVETVGHKLYFTEVESVDLDHVINILQELKQKGSNRVYIAEHVDHHGYYFYGVKLEEVQDEN